jgi:hypothetical protein
MNRTITWRGVIARIGISGIDGRQLDTLRFDRLPVPAYWYNPNINHSYSRYASDFQLLGKVTEAYIVRNFGGLVGSVNAEMELDLATLPTPDETLWPAADLNVDYTQLAAVCLSARPIWADLTPVIVVT